MSKDKDFSENGKQNVVIIPGTDLNDITTEKTKAEQILEKYSHLRITDTTDIPHPVEVVKINGELICTQGGVTTISGASKSGKSAFTGVIIAGALSEGGYDGFDSVDVAPCNGKAVILFDSEQKPYKHKRNVHSILSRANLTSTPANFQTYNFTSEPVDDCIKMTTDIVWAANELFNGVHMVVIDGGADYIRDVNDPEQSNMIVKFFGDLAITYNTCVIVVVHVNPGSDKERGHLGSQLQRKSESVLTVKTQGDISFLEPKYLRMAGKGDIPVIQFMYDKGKGYHVYCGVREDKEKDAERIANLLEITQSVFSPPLALDYETSIERIMKHIKRGERIAKDTFKEIKAHEMIIQGEDKNWRINTNYQ